MVTRVARFVNAPKARRVQTPVHTWNGSPSNALVSASAVMLMDERLLGTMNL